MSSARVMRSAFAVIPDGNQIGVDQFGCRSGIQSQAQNHYLDSGFARYFARPGMTRLFIATPACR
jgi:hypothetical protein